MTDRRLSGGCSFLHESSGSTPGSNQIGFVTFEFQRQLKRRFDQPIREVRCHRWEVLLEHAREKLVAKGLDAIVANDVSRADSGFDSENNAVVILLRNDPQPVELPLMPKLETAHRILDEVVKLRRASSGNEAASIKSA